MPKARKRKRQQATAAPDSKRGIKPNERGSSNARNEIFKGEETDDDNWISKLAKSSVASNSSSSGIPPSSHSKEERIQKRQAKKLRRERKKEQNACRTETIIIEKKQYSSEMLTSSTIRNKRKSSNSNDALVETINSNNNRRLLLRLSKNVSDIVQRILEERRHTTPSSRRSKLYIESNVSIKGKATSGQKMTDKMLQPRKNDYGGLGLARPSIYLPLWDPSFKPKFEEEFLKHVDGFFGKQRTKAMKKQTDGNMLWRRLLKDKTSSSSSSSSSSGGKTKSPLLLATKKVLNGMTIEKMSSDEKIEALIKAGVI